MKSGRLEQSQPAPLVNGRALNADAVAEIGWSREPAFALPLALDVDRRCAVRILQVESHDSALGMARATAGMLLVQRLANLESGFEIADAVGDEQPGNFIGSKS